jgi:hypothetical protein
MTFGETETAFIGILLSSGVGEAFPSILIEIDGFSFGLYFMRLQQLALAFFDLLPLIKDLHVGSITFPSK